MGNSARPKVISRGQESFSLGDSVFWGLDEDLRAVPGRALRHRRPQAPREGALATFLEEKC